MAPLNFLYKFKLQAMNKLIVNKMDYLKIHQCIDIARRQNTIGATEADSLINELHSADIVEPREIPGDVVTMNSIVKISFLNTKKSMQFRIVYPDEANIRENKISIFSPVATALLGYKVKDEIEWIVPSGPANIRIDELVYQPEAEGDFYS
jgi:regulator of nucleoside diphosphate kinase